MWTGILTYHHTTNFGSLLQTYALFKKVTELGFECEVIDYRNKAVEARETPRRLKQCKGVRQIRDFFKYEKFKRKKAEAFKEFTRKYIHISVDTYDADTIKNIENKYDIFIVGSDLVWDFTINGKDTTYMLDFADKGVRKVAYASSVGQIWDENQINEVNRLLGAFDSIGVREYEIQKELSKQLGRDVDFVGDPTMLIEPKDWKKLADSRMIPGKYILVYFADKDLKIYKDAVEYGNKNGIPVYLISYSWVPESMKAIRPARVEEFLSLILYADTVFTASYHGMLFSLYFEKNFYYYNRGWKARMRSIASYLGIEDREQVPGNGFSLSFFFRFQSAERAGGVDKGNNRPAEFFRLLHQAEGFPVSLGRGHSVIAPDAVLHIAPFMNPDYRDGLAA